MRIVVDESLSAHTRSRADEVIRGILVGMPKAERLVVDALYVGNRWSVRVLLMPDPRDPDASDGAASQTLLEDVVRSRLDMLVRRIDHL